LTPPAAGRLNWAALRMGAVLAWRLATQVGMGSDYRRHFWKTFWLAARNGQIDAAMGMGFVSHHLITFAREAVTGGQNASFYSARLRKG
jgi:hypothetical protein